MGGKGSKQKKEGKDGKAVDPKQKLAGGKSIRKSLRGGKMTADIEKELKEDFALFDADGSGKVSTTELRTALRLRGLPLTEEEVKQCISEVDKDGDGEVNFSEFCQLMTVNDEKAKTAEKSTIDGLFKEMEEEQAEYEKEAQKEFESKEDPDSKVSDETIIVGPVVGKCTETTARVLIETQGDCTIVCTAEDKTQTRSSKHIVEVKQEFKGHSPAVFKISGLRQASRYEITFSGAGNDKILGSFRTVDPKQAHWNVVAASCDRGKDKRGKGTLFGKLQKEYIETGKLDLFVRHGDQVYADVAFHQGQHVLKDKSLSEDEKDKKILECYKVVYRKVWAASDVREVMANVPCLMLWDDHEIRNDWGTFKQDTDHNSVDYRIAKGARRAYWEYQRQLWTDLGVETSTQSTPESAHWKTQPALSSLEFCVIGGRHLVALDGGKTSDPYVQISLVDEEGKVIKSEKSEKQSKTVTPTWDYKLPAVDAKELSRVYWIKLQVWDSDELSADDFMGEIELPFRVGCQFQAGKHNDVWIPLTTSREKDLNGANLISGELHLTVKYEREKETKTPSKEEEYEAETEGSFHVYGQFGLVLIDGRGARSFSYQTGESKKFLGSQQWYKIKQALSPDGIFKNVKALLVVHSMAPVLMSTEASGTIGHIPPQVDKMGFGLHPQEQCDYLDLLDKWAHGTDGKGKREFFLIGGDMHFGVLTNIYRAPNDQKKKKDKDLQLVCQQMITSAISNSMPPKPVYWMLRRFMKGQGTLGHVGQPLRFKFRHFQYVYDRNFGLIEFALRKDKPTIKGTIITGKTKDTRGAEAAEADKKPKDKKPKDKKPKVLEEDEESED